MSFGYLRILLYTLVFCSLTASANADFVPLPATAEQLSVAGAYTEVGGLCFDSFSFSSQNAVPLGAIDISAFNNGTQEGLSFTFSTAFAASGASAVGDLSFQYKVTTLSSNSQINGSLLQIAGTVNNNAVANVFMSAFQVTTPPNLNDLADNYTYLDGINGNYLSDSSNFLPQSQIQVTSDIQLASFADDGFVQINQVTQAFSLSSVPEPTSMIPLGIGMVTLAGYSVYRGKREQ
jgi:hypothetical protein